jgi:hypothetical protein
MWLPIELDTRLDVVKVEYVELKSIYEFIALFNGIPLGAYFIYLNFDSTVYWPDDGYA